MTPSSTYRLQIRPGFTLHDAAALAGYLAELGVGAVYLSPLLRATSGSDHGYDTTDPTVIDPDRGGEEGWRALLDAAREHELGVVVDIVPNHLGIAVPHENPAWWDVLTHGRESRYADWFDVDWSAGPIILPVLGDEGGPELVDGELRYFEHRFPLAPGSWADGDDAATVHDRQHYRLAHWSRGDHELTYRRFFSITTLAGVRVEDEQVFAATHAKITDLVADGVAGLRIDHPDGLADPTGYLERLRRLAPDAWIVAEKILEPGEELPAEWPIAGSTGYDALAEVDRVLRDQDHDAPLTELYRELTGDGTGFEEYVERGKRMVAETLFQAERRRLARLAPDVERAGEALAEIAIAYEVYRSYLPIGADRLDWALAEAARRRPELAETLSTLGSRLRDPADELAVRVQQLAGAVMAKGVEDTAYYRYSRFVGGNEVGGDPAQVGGTVEEFHAAQRRRLDGSPDAMTALSTHDTKRGEDVRARLAVLPELHDHWAGFAAAFLDRTGLPNRRFGYLLAQTLAGTGPIDRDRLQAYAEKAAREAAEETGWTRVDAAYESALRSAIDLAYDDPEVRAAWDLLDAMITGPGRSNALAAKLLQLTAPGVPDVYQGTELWTDSLVDPDNRRPVDFGRRASLLAGLDHAPPIDDSGAAKLWVTRNALRLRREAPELFTDYRPLSATGPATRHLIGYDRGGAITLATRLPVGLARTGWAGTTVDLPDGLHDRLSGREVPGGRTELAALLADYPVALLAPAR
ncbi:malto-oligosyltrehalose synthase [Microlunatus parietis]|uniref:(1->4)-alpha-D-glucan 1-alpha-D-glucosylmutase n=1 Tax=Microlunatus parietis TaxID=682979 RepID=A0A7Y9I744_9ACTN|nr:malto-oligosyltrehalose synthase [Microlunatus parietis]NYE71211.1 (1->4)-alpha-D-glucan 1-alpha-D-glucosylmutase [Microlunatus parietis]